MPHTNHWAIVDKLGIITEGTEEFIKNEWNKLHLDGLGIAPQLKGDVMLIEIHGQIKQDGVL